MNEHHSPGILESGTARSWDGGASFTLANRMYRATWIICWLVLAAWTPPPLHRWRRWILCLFGAQIGRSAHVYGSARIWSPANLVLGERAAIGRKANIYSMGPIKIGSYAVISQGAHLCSGTHDVNDPNFQLQVRPVNIGDRAWIAAEAFVGPGVTVGTGAVLGARGCAMRDLQPWTIYGGNPAEILGSRKLSAYYATDEY